MLRDGKRVGPRGGAAGARRSRSCRRRIRRAARFAGATRSSASVEDFDVQELPAGAGHRRCPGGAGVAVSRVTDHGAADQAGLKVGDVVLRIGNAGVRTPADVATRARRLQGRRDGAAAGPPLRVRLLDGVRAAVREATVTAMMDEKTYRHLLDDSLRARRPRLRGRRPRRRRGGGLPGDADDHVPGEAAADADAAALAPAALGRVPRSRLALRLERGAPGVARRSRPGDRPLWAASSRRPARWAA